MFSKIMKYVTLIVEWLKNIFSTPCHCNTTNTTDKKDDVSVEVKDENISVEVKSDDKIVIKVAPTRKRTPGKKEEPKQQ